MPGRIRLYTTLAALAVGVAACLIRPLPFGEGLLVVDTDVSIPKRVNRLRIDVHNKDGALIETRELSAARPQDWPISFSVTADREENRDVTVRLRAYLEGHIVSRAEALANSQAAAEARVFDSIQETCANAPTLNLGEPLTLRRGGTALTTVLPSSKSDAGTPKCTDPTRSGSVAAKVEITDTDSYRFEVVASTPNGARDEAGGHITLSLRRDCVLPTTQMECDDVEPGSKGSGITAELTPGSYWIVTGGKDPAPADLTLLASRLNAAVVVKPPPPPPSGDPNALEPAPGTTIDRLVRLTLVPGYRGTVHVTLAGECFGTPADVTNLRTCVDKEGQRDSVLPILADGPLTRTAPPPQLWRGEQTEPCSVQARPEEVCVPGGAFLFGDTLALTDLDFRTQPERVRIVPPMLIDRFEFSVARYREALRRGFAPSDSDPAVNDSALGPTATCTWNRGTRPEDPAPGIDRESFPLTCVTFARARALCNFFGSDLPSEDQWEYAATASGRAVETQYPWGSERPTCERTIVERSGAAGALCSSGYGPTPVADPSWSALDRTPDGIVGMGGNVHEWLSTGFYAYSDPVWAQAGLRAPLPAAANDTAPLRATRGGDWASFGLYATASARRAVPATGNYDNLGFRCARLGR